MRWKATDDHCLQAWIIIFCSLLSFCIGLGEIGLGIWLTFFSRNIQLILGEPMINVYYGYTSIGALASILAVVGCIGSLLRRRLLLLAYVILLLASIVCQCVIWAFIYTEQSKVSNDLANRIARAPENFEFIDSHYNCQLQGPTLGPTVSSDVLESCSNFLNRQLWILVWAQLGLCASLICLQVVLVLMAGLMAQLLKDSNTRRQLCRVHPFQDRTLYEENPERYRNSHTEEEETTSPTSRFVVHASNPIPYTPPFVTTPSAFSSSTTFPTGSHKPGTLPSPYFDMCYKNLNSKDWEVDAFIKSGVSVTPL